MDEVRRLRFFIPVAIFVMTIAVFSPDAIIATSRELQRMVEARTPGPDASSIIPTAILLAIGSSLAIGLGFVISTIMHACLLGIRRYDSWSDPEAPESKLGLPDGDSEYAAFVLKNYLQHMSAEGIKSWIVRRWEMLIVSWNSFGAIVLAFMVIFAQKVSAGLFALSFLTMVAFGFCLLVCGLRAHDDINDMTDYLAFRERRRLAAKVAKRSSRPAASYLNVSRIRRPRKRKP